MYVKGYFLSHDPTKEKNSAILWKAFFSVKFLVGHPLGLQFIKLFLKRFPLKVIQLNDTTSHLTLGVLGLLWTCGSSSWLLLSSIAMREVPYTGLGGRFCRVDLLTHPSCSFLGALPLWPVLVVASSLVSLSASESSFISVEKSNVAGVYL